MSKQLIISADDFGFSPAYSIGNIVGATKGVVSVFGLMSNMDAAPYAIDLWKKYAPQVELGLHVNFVQGRPVSDPKDIPSLVNKEGFFYRSTYWKSENPNDPKCKGDVYPTYEDLKRETEAQIERFKELVGSYPIHIEGHSTGTKPMMEAFNDVARERGIHCMGMSVGINEHMRPVSEKMVPGIANVLNNGSTVDDWLEDRFELLSREEDLIELHFHPGYLDQYVLDNTSLTLARCRDLDTLCDPRVRSWIEGHDFELVGYSAIYC